MYLFVLCFEGVVVANDTACLWPILSSGSSMVCQMTEGWEIFLHIQNV